MLFFVTLPTYDVDKNKPPHQWPRFLLVSKPMRTGQDRNQYQASAVQQRSCQAAGGLAAIYLLWPTYGPKTIFHCSTNLSGPKTIFHCSTNLSWCFNTKDMFEIQNKIKYNRLLRISTSDLYVQNVPTNEFV